MEAYQTLQKRLEIPENLMPILTRLVSRGESEILALMTEEFLTAFTITEKLGEKNLNSLASILKTLYQKGFLNKKTIEGEEAYRCRSFYDIIRSHLEEGRYDVLGPDNLHMLRQYYMSTRISKTEQTVKDGQLKYSSKVIPIKKAFSPTQYILPTQQAVEFLREARIIGLAKCGCRVAFRNCGNPIDTCLLLDEEAEYMISRGHAKSIPIEEAKKILKIANEAGLVHLTLYLPGQKVYAVCSCCPCCCHDLQALLTYRKTFFTAKADYVATCNTDICIGCGTCIDRCIFGAREMEAGKAIVKEDYCYGCGLCVTTCPTEATELIPRKRG